MKILLAIDHSAASQAAINEAAVRPWPAGASVEAISVVDTSAPWLTSDVIEEVTRRTKDLVQRAAERLASSGSDRHHASLLRRSQDRNPGPGR